MAEPPSVTIKAHVELHLDLGSEKEAMTIYAALLPETESVPSERAKTSVEVKGSVLIIRVQAEDLTALRAATNSFLSWVSSCRRTLESVTGHNA